MTLIATLKFLHALTGFWFTAVWRRLSSWRHGLKPSAAIPAARRIVHSGMPAPECATGVVPDDGVQTLRQRCHQAWTRFSQRVTKSSGGLWGVISMP